MKTICHFPRAESKKFCANTSNQPGQDKHEDYLLRSPGDLRLLIGGFRQNPKKFLSFKVNIF